MTSEHPRRIFISYSRINKDFATKFTKGLRAAGFSVWMDLLDIPTGSRWDDEVENALRECSIFLVILTPASIASENVKDEIGYAIDHGKRILPVLLQDCDVPLRLRRFQHVDFTTLSPQKGFESVKQLLKDLVDQATVPLPAKPPVVEAQIDQKAEAEKLDRTKHFSFQREILKKASDLLKQGTQLAADKDWAQAAQTFREVLALFPNHGETQSLLANAEAQLLQERELADRKTQDQVAKTSVVEAHKEQKAKGEELAQAKIRTESKNKQETDRLATQKAEAERLAQAKIEAERKAKIEADRLLAEKAEAERLAKQKAEAERVAQAKVEAERKAKIEADRLAAEKAEAERLAKQKAEREAKAEAERVAQAKAEAERKAKIEADRLVAERAEAERKGKPMPALPIESKVETVSAATAQKKPVSKGLMIGMVAVVALVIAGIGFGALSKRGSNTPPVDNPATEALVVANPVTETPVESPTSSEPGIGSTMTGDAGMTLVYVPAGLFRMGSDFGETDEVPVHEVNLDAFWIDQTEVTNKMYAACVAADTCAPPASSSSQTQASYYGNTRFDNYPVIYVNWDNARAFCAWAGRRLPTEAEWEKAARGTDERAYPWGKVITSALANYGNKVGDTTAAGNYEDGKSPYGALDMAGNVLEWVSDWYDETYYESSPASNPLGPDAGNLRVLRGGSWNKTDYSARSASRSMEDPTNSDNRIGFRCALSIP